jgi:hypothetical protein
MRAHDPFDEPERSPFFIPCDARKARRARSVGTDPASQKTPNATTVAAMEAADGGEVKETSLTKLARIWEGACAKSSGRRS